MKVILSPKTIKASNIFDVLEKKVEPCEFISLRNNLNQSYNLWKGCNITLSITLCRDSYIKFCNDTTSVPNVSFKERLKDINCEYTFAIVLNTYEQQIILHILLNNKRNEVCIYPKPAYIID